MVGDLSISKDPHLSLAHPCLTMGTNLIALFTTTTVEKRAIRFPITLEERRAGFFTKIRQSVDSSNSFTQGICISYSFHLPFVLFTRYTIRHEY